MTGHAVVGLRLLDTGRVQVDDHQVFGLQPVEGALLLFCALGVVSAVVGRSTGVLSLRQSLLALAVALVLPVVGSVISLALLVAGWRDHRRATAPVA